MIVPMRRKGDGEQFAIPRLIQASKHIVDVGSQTFPTNQRRNMKHRDEIMARDAGSDLQGASSCQIPRGTGQSQADEEPWSVLSFPPWAVFPVVWLRGWH